MIPGPTDSLKSSRRAETGGKQNTSTQGVCIYVYYTYYSHANQP